MTRSVLITGRCKAPGGCGQWLVKYDPATNTVTKTNRGVKITNTHQRNHAGSESILDAIGYKWSEDPIAVRLVESGVMVEPTPGSQEMPVADMGVVVLFIGRLLTN